MQPLFAQSIDAALERLSEFPLLWPYLLLAAGVLVVLLLVRRFLRRGRANRGALTADLTIDVAALAQDRPPGKTPAELLEGPPRLEFYNLPVRLLAVIIAPVGRLREPPASEDLTDIIDCILPGLDQIAAAHMPAVRIWPRQVSVRGFAHSFFTHVKLPGAEDKKNPWSTVAGLFKVDGQPMMAALVLETNRPNRHGQYIMEREEDWLGILRIRLQ